MSRRNESAVTMREAAYYNQLVGRMIVRIDWVNPIVLGFPASDPWFPKLVFANGTTALVWCDPEGNGPGHLHIEQALPKSEPHIHPEHRGVEPSHREPTEDIQDRNPMRSQHWGKGEY